jgi:hypothetical protein
MVGALAPDTALIDANRRRWRGRQQRVERRSFDGERGNDGYVCF